MALGLWNKMFSEISHSALSDFSYEIISSLRIIHALLNHVFIMMSWVTMSPLQPHSGLKEAEGLSISQINLVCPSFGWTQPQNPSKDIPTVLL